MKVYEGMQPPIRIAPRPLVLRVARTVAAAAIIATLMGVATMIGAVGAGEHTSPQFITP